MQKTNQIISDSVGGIIKNFSLSNSETPSAVVVTGAASGIGRATVFFLLCRGHCVVYTNLDSAALSEAAQAGLGIAIPTDGGWLAR